MEDHDSLSTSTSYRSTHFAIPSRRSLPFPVPPVSIRINDSVFSNEITSPTVSSKKQSNQNTTIFQRVPSDEVTIREACSARTSKNIVSARSQGHPRLNDIAVNDKTLGMTVQPCRLHADTPKNDDQLVTWKQIGRKKDSLPVNHNFSKELQPNLDPAVENDLSITKNDFVRTDDEVKDSEMDKVKNDVVTWSGDFQNLNQTYLITDSLDDFEQLEMFHGNCKQIRHSPRVEFYFMDEKREGIKNMKCEREELKMNANGKMIEHKVKELQINSEDNWKISGLEETEGMKCKTEKLEHEDKKINHVASDKKTKVKKHNVRKIEIQLENKEDILKMNDINVAKVEKLNANERNHKDQQTTMDDENIKYPEIRERNLLDFDEDIKLSQDALQKYKRSSEELKKSTTNKHNFILDQEYSHPRRKEASLAFSDSFVSQDYPELEKKTSRYKSNACCNNSLELKKNVTTGTCDRFDKNYIFLNNNEINCNLNPENQVFLHQNNMCSDLLDLQQNTKTSLMLRKLDGTGNFAEERYEKDLIVFDDEKSQKSFEGSKNSEISSSQNSEVVAGNCLNAYTDNELQIDVNGKHGKLFNSKNVEIVKNDKTTDANVNNRLSNKTRFFGRLIAEGKVTTDEDSRMKNTNSDFVCDNDNATCEQRNTRGANDLESSITSKEDIEKSRRHRDGILSKSVSFSRRVSSPTRRAIKEHPINSVEMKHKIQENMNLLRGSTDSLISSAEFVELASIRRPQTNCAYERETVEVIGPRRQSRVYRNLPDIRDDSAETRDAAERNSYWEKASKISRSRLIGFDPSCRYRLARRNPRVRILSPVPGPSSINQR